jgi:hypothetical protein
VLVLVLALLSGEVIDDDHAHEHDWGGRPRIWLILLVLVLVVVLALVSGEVIDDEHDWGGEKGASPLPAHPLLFQARKLDQVRVGGRGAIAKMVFDETGPVLGVVDRIEAEPGGEGSPLIVVEQRPVHISD